MRPARAYGLKKFGHEALGQQRMQGFVGFCCVPVAYRLLAYQSENLGFRVNQLGNQHW